MGLNKFLKFALVVVAAALMIILDYSPGLAQFGFDPADYRFKFEELQLYSDPSIPKAPVEVDGNIILSVGKIDSNPAGERASVIRSEIYEAIKDDDFSGVAIEEQERLPVLYLTYQQNPAQNLTSSPRVKPQEVRRYLFTITKEDIIGKKSNRETALDLKQEIEQAITKAKKERKPGFIRRQIFISLALILLAILGSRLLNQLQTYPLRRAIQKVIPGFPDSSSSQASNLTTLLRLKLGFAQFLLWIGTIFGIFQLFPYTRHWQYVILSIVTRTFNKSVFTFGGNQFSIITLLILAGLLIGSIFASGYIANLLRTKVLQVTRMSRGSQEIISIVTKYGLISLATVVLLQAYGLNLSSLALIGSALGVGIGFGFQDIARNFASGIVLLFERSIQIGDFIQVGNHQGVVEEVRTRSIVLKTLDRISIIVPNSRFLSEEVINWNHRKSVSRLHLPMGVAYGSDVIKVKASLLQAAEEHLEVLRNPTPQVLFTAFGDSSLNFELLIWTSDPSRQSILKSDIYFRIEELFKENHIDIPFPQRDINLKGGDLPIKLPHQLEAQMLQLLRGLISNQPNLNKHSDNKPGKQGQ